MINVYEYIQGIVSKITSRDIIDIFFIASFIYFLLVGVRRTRVRFVFIGIVFVGMIYITARILGLYLTTIALQAFFAVFMVVMVIIFQDELRHLFEQLAILGTFKSPSAKEDVFFNSRVDIISRAIATLSRKKIGALIVMKGKEPIERYLEAGKPFDAVMSAEVLEGVFHPETPTHDGAIVIVGERIVKFGCHLPLSTNIQEVGRSGTRHAAGMGLCERTDSLCLIVSEETGEISVAENSRLTHMYDLMQLQARLKNFYAERFVPSKKTNFFHAAVSHSLEKIIAVVLAVGLWLAFANPGEVVRRYFVVPVEYRNVPVDVVIAEPKLKEATVTLSGTEQKFNLFHENELKISLDEARIKDGENKILLTSDLLKGEMTGLSIVDVEPDQAVLNAYTLLPVSIPVRMNTAGELPSSVVMKSITIIPEKVSALFPSTFPQDDLTIRMEPIDISKIDTTKTFKASLIIPDNVRFKNNKIPDITVTVAVEPKKPQLSAQHVNKHADTP